MRKNKLTPLFILLILAGSLWAQFPNHEMERNTLGVKAQLSFRGQNITEDEVPANETMPFLYLAYAPFEYLVLNAGMGFDRYDVNKNDGVEFMGNYGFSPSVGLDLYTPFITPWFRITGGGNVQYFTSEDDYDYRYYGAVLNASLGIILSPSQFVDVGLGVKWHRVEGKIEQPVEVGQEPVSDVYFSNTNEGRGYISLTLLSPLERVFLHTAFEASPELGKDWEQGPPESTFSISLGMLLGWKERKKPSKKGPIYFPEMPELREISKEMENHETEEEKEENKKAEEAEKAEAAEKTEKMEPAAEAQK